LTSLKQEFETYISYIKDHPELKTELNDHIIRIIKEMLKTFDFETFEAKRVFYNQEQYREATGARAKYFDFVKYFESKLRSLMELGLHTSSPLSILDIGTGAGHFPFLCSRFNHEVIASDIPEGSRDGSFLKEEAPRDPNWRKSEDINRIYTDIIKLLEVDWRPLRIQPMEKLPDFGTKFDLITAFMINFNKYRKQKTMWQLEEWMFLFEDILKNQLNKDGRIFFQLNRAPETPGLQHDDPVLIESLKKLDTRFKIKDSTITLGSFE